MKKYLLLIISMLCVSIGTWAQDPATSGTFGPNNSEWSLADGVLTLTVKNAADVTNESNPTKNLLTTEQLETVKRLKVVTASGVKLTGSYWGTPLYVLYTNYMNVPVLDLSEAEIQLFKMTDWSRGGIEVDVLPTDNGNWYKNIVVPAAYRGNPSSLPICFSQWSSASVPTNRYTLTGTGTGTETITVAIYEDYDDPSKLAPLSCFGSSMKTLKINNEVGTIDLTDVLVSGNNLDLTVITTGATDYAPGEPPTCSNPITVSDGVNVICANNEVKKRVQGGNLVDVTPDIVCDADEIESALTDLNTYGIAPNSIKITSAEPVSADALTKLNISGLRRIDLSDATMASGVDVNNITLPTTLQELVLPKGSVVSDGLKTEAIANNNLNYIYSPTSDTQNRNQTVADYVWVNKPGGLWQAMEKENHLRTAVYVKIACDVAGGVQLNEDDAKFGNHSINATSEKDYPWQYIDLSATFFGVAATNANTAPHNKGYRIILPDNLTGDNMALFASKPKADISDDPDRGYRGIPAAVYSYKGTTLSIMEITDASYLPDALHDSRIVRSGTTEVRVISGSYGSEMYGVFGPHLLTALNSAAESITKAKVSVGEHFVNTDNTDDTPLSSPTNFTFNNGHLTELMLDDINNTHVQIVVGTGCTSLTTLEMQNATVKSVSATDVTSLTKASLDYTTTTGDIDLSGCTSLTTLNIDNTNLGATSTGGVLDISDCTALTSLNLSTLKAKSVNASNTDALATLNLNGIKLNDVDDSYTWEYDDYYDELRSLKSGTVELTRTPSGNYSNLQVYYNTDFITERLIPTVAESGVPYETCHDNYEKDEEDWEGRVKTWAENHWDDSYLSDGWVAPDKEDYYTKLTFADENGIYETAYGDIINGESTDEQKNQALNDWWAANPTVTANYDSWYNDYLMDQKLRYLDYDKIESDYEAANPADPRPVENCTPTGYTGNTVPDTKEEITLAGNTLSEKMEEHGGDVYAGSVQILHVTGELTSADITYIKEKMPNLDLLDLSECTNAVTATNLIGNIPTTTAIVLPGVSATNGAIAQTESSRASDIYQLKQANYDCVAYYTETKRGTSGDYKTLNVYATNNAVAKLQSGTVDGNKKVVDEKTILYFLPEYTSGTIHEPYKSTEVGYTRVSQGLLAGLHKLDAGCVDLTWINISDLGTNFSKLNGNTKYLIIPQNESVAQANRGGVNYNNDFTDVNATGVTNYRYSSGLKAVSTYKGTSSPYATESRFGGDALSFDGNYGHIADKTANLMYVMSSSELVQISDLIPSNLKNANITAVVSSTGQLNSGVEQGLAAFDSEILDLTRVTLASDVDWSLYENASVKCIAMPYGFDSNSDGQTTLSDLSSLGLSRTDGSCPQLMTIGTLVKSEEIFASTTRKSTLVFQSYKEGGIENLLTVLYALNKQQRAYTITSLIGGGPVNAKDITTRSESIDNEGHLMTTVGAGNIVTVMSGGNSGSLSGYTGLMDTWDLSKVTLPNYNSRDGKAYCFDNSTHTYATSDDVVDGGYSFQNDLSFANIGIVPNKSQKESFTCSLPTDDSVWRLPDDAFTYAPMTDLHLPHNYQYLGTSAFYDTKISHITTTDASGNLIDNGPLTYTLSANLKEIGNNPGYTGNIPNMISFTVFPQNTGVTDVYSLAHKVPKCYSGAFPANMLYGWGGFRGGTFPYCREKYDNSGNSEGGKPEIFTVLHFPDKASYKEAADDVKESSYEQMQRYYTDVTKVYTKKEQTGAVDANGDEISWPTFSELRRAYNQASDGIIWDDWVANYDNNHAVNGGNYIPTTTQPDATTPGKGNHSPLITVDTDGYNFAGYEGWHQFVLSLATYVEPDKYNQQEREFEEGGWYTFCIPFDMTESQVYEMLGVPFSTDRYTNIVGGEEVRKSDESIGTGRIDRLMPKIHTLKEVTRKPSDGSSLNQIILKLTKNLGQKYDGQYQYMKVDNSADIPGITYPSCGGDPADPIVIKGGYPYYIKPYLPKGMTVKNLGKYVMTRYSDMFKQAASCANHDGTKEYLGTSGTNLATLWFAKPFEEHKIQALLEKGEDDVAYAKHHDDDQDDSNDKKYYYTFVGQFWDQPLPHYCYYTIEGSGTWYRFTRFDETTASYKWNAYKCVILVTKEVDDTDTHPTSGKFRDNANSNYPHVSTEDWGTQVDLLEGGTLKIEFLDGIDDYDFVNSARETMFIFDDDIVDVGDGSETTAIDTLDGERILPATGKVYNMNGQHVGNSLNGLPKGMYIVNGKKVIIK